MTLDEAIQILKSRNYSYRVVEYDNEEAFLRHIYLFPDTRDSTNCKVKSLVVPCNNEHKDIELQFNEYKGEFYFVELLFGDFCFEMNECPEIYLKNEILDIVYQITSEQLAIVLKNDLKHKKWISDDCYVLSDDDPTFGEPAFITALNKIQRPKNAAEKLRNSRIQYEIYSFNSYQCIIK